MGWTSNYQDEFGSESFVQLFDGKRKIGTGFEGELVTSQVAPYLPLFIMQETLAIDWKLVPSAILMKGFEQSTPLVRGSYSRFKTGDLGHEVGTASTRADTKSYFPMQILASVSHAQFLLQFHKGILPFTQRGADRIGRMETFIPDPQPLGRGTTGIDRPTRL